MRGQVQLVDQEADRGFRAPIDVSQGLLASRLFSGRAEERKMSASNAAVASQHACFMQTGLPLLGLSNLVLTPNATPTVKWPTLSRHAAPGKWGCRKGVYPIRRAKVEPELESEVVLSHFGRLARSKRMDFTARESVLGAWARSKSPIGWATAGGKGNGLLSLDDQHSTL
ncbi:hypothetical protein BDV93DRAFT_547658 [Ceratobasidium sp. AG-I]|nr:hypothetical protein BDV93DRAFT_547658 [Ceratobasidium sp. AG-I]